MKTIVSKLLSIIYIQNVRIVAGENTVSNSEYDRLVEDATFNALVKSGKLETSDSVAPESYNEKVIEDMTLGELKEYAKQLGITGMSQSNKSDLLEVIKAVEE